MLALPVLREHFRLHELDSADITDKVGMLLFGSAADGLGRPSLSFGKLPQAVRLLLVEFAGVLVRQTQEPGAVLLAAGVFLFL